MAEPFKVVPGRIVLLKADKDKYHVALINSMNGDGSANLSVFPPPDYGGGAVYKCNNAFQGTEKGNWAPPGVDAEPTAKAKPVDSASQPSTSEKLEKFSKK